MCAAPSSGNNECFFCVCVSYALMMAVVVAVIAVVGVVVMIKDRPDRRMVPCATSQCPWVKIRHTDGFLFPQGFRLYFPLLLFLPFFYIYIFLLTYLFHLFIFFLFLCIAVYRLSLLFIPFSRFPLSTHLYRLHPSYGFSQNFSSYCLSCLFSSLLVRKIEECNFSLALSTYP